MASGKAKDLLKIKTPEKILQDLKYSHEK